MSNTRLRFGVLLCISPFILVLPIGLTCVLTCAEGYSQQESGISQSLDATSREQSRVGAGDGNARDCFSVENRVRAVYQIVSPSIVRITCEGQTGAIRYGPATGVIVSADGYVVTTDGTIRMRGQGTALVMHMASGRRVSTTELGWSREYGIGLMKITEEGPWPYVELRAPTAAAGRYCVAMGYPPQFVGGEFDRQPALRFGFITCCSSSTWLTSSCAITGYDLGGGLFDLEGRLLGISSHVPFGDDPVHTNIGILQTHWDDLVAGANLDQVRLLVPAGKAKKAQEHVQTDLQSKGEDGQPPASIAKASLATIRFRGKSEEKRGRSGVIVTADGYVITCGHHRLLPGEEVTFYLPDGRDVSGVVLGTNLVSDIGLLKITDEGPWTHVEMGNSTTMRSGEQCFGIGYPTDHQARQPLVRETEVIERENKPWSCLLWTSEYNHRGGDSGGGLFDLQGRVVGVILGGATGGMRDVRHGRIELFRKHWDGLSARQSIGMPNSDPLADITAAFHSMANELPSVVVDVLCDRKKQVLGTIVTSDGLVLTKASRLDGALSCRLTDGRIVPARVERALRDHDLALLKIEAVNLPEICWSESENIPVGTLLAGIVPGKPPLVGVVSLAARSIPPQTGRSALSRVFDTDIYVPPHLCGGPVVDKTGKVIGITIASTPRRPTHVIPTAIAKKIAKQAGERTQAPACPQ